MKNPSASEKAKRQSRSKRAISRLTGTFSAQFNDLLVVKFLDSTHVIYFTVIKLLKAGFPLRVQNLQVKKLTPSKARKV